MTDKDMANAAAASAKLGKSGIKAATSLSKKLAANMYKNNNKYMYRKYGSAGAAEYVSLKNVANVTTFRYFYDDSKTTATMTSNSLIYIFKKGSKEMYKQSTDTAPEMMTSKAVGQSEIYLAEEDSLTYFGCSAEYLAGTNYAVCLTAKMQTTVDDAVEAVIDNIN